MNFTLPLDNFLTERMRTLEPHFNIPDMSKPYSVSGNLTLLAPANNCLANYLYDKSDDPANDKILTTLNSVEVEIKE